MVLRCGDVALLVFPFDSSSPFSFLRRACRRPFESLHPTSDAERVTWKPSFANNLTPLGRPKRRRPTLVVRESGQWKLDAPRRRHDDLDDRDDDECPADQFKNISAPPDSSLRVARRQPRHPRIEYGIPPEALEYHQANRRHSFPSLVSTATSARRRDD